MPWFQWSKGTDISYSLKNNLKVIIQICSYQMFLTINSVFYYPVVVLSNCSHGNTHIGQSICPGERPSNHGYFEEAHFFGKAKQAIVVMSFVLVQRARIELIISFLSLSKYTSDNIYKRFSNQTLYYNYIWNCIQHNIKVYSCVQLRVCIKCLVKQRTRNSANRADSTGSTCYATANRVSLVMNS